MKYYQKKSFLSFLERGRIVPDHVEERGRGGGCSLLVLVWSEWNPGLVVMRRNEAVGGDRRRIC